MRILQISSARNFGGGERHFVDLCRGLSERGHEVFVALRPTNDWQSRLDFIPAENILHVSIRNSFGIFSANRMAGFLRENEIDIMHAHAARDYIPASLACLMAKNSRFVLTRHVMFPLKPFNKYALKNLSKAIGVSSGVGESLKRVFPGDKIEVIPNGLDIAVREGATREDLGSGFRTLHGIPPDAVLIGTVGELLPLKGQQDFVLAAAEIIKIIPNARFLIAGKDNTIDKRHRRDLKRLVGVLEMADKYLWLDWVDDTPSLFSAMDIFVSPSHSESFGLAMLEAMAHATPVVATDTEGARELLIDKEMVVPINDPVRMATVICEQLADREKCRATGVELRRRAAQTFSLSAMVDRTEEVYLEILDQTRKAVTSEK